MMDAVIQISPDDGSAAALTAAYNRLRGVASDLVSGSHLPADEFETLGRDYFCAGDQTGKRSGAGLRVRLRFPLPSAFIT